MWLLTSLFDDMVDEMVSYETDYDMVNEID